MYKRLTYLASLILLMGLSTTATRAELVAYYPLNGDAIDASGNGHDGTFVGQPQTVAGRFGDALAFQGQDYISVADYIPVSGAGDRTVTVWIKTESTGVNGIVSWGIIQGQRKWVIRQQNQYLRLEIEGDAIRGSTPVADGQWHHIAVTFANDGTPELGDAVFYVDGVLDSHTSKTQHVDTSPTGNLEIGRNLKNDGRFVGSIDEVRIYDSALTAEEVLEDMNGGLRHAKAGKPSPADGATDVPRDTDLSWAPGSVAQTHDLYFGLEPEDVADANGANPLSVLARQGQDANSYDPPDLLEFGKTYYWRIDEVNAPPDSTVFPGPVWSFTVEPFAYPIAGVNATASSFAQDMEPQKTADGSGLTEGKHSTLDTDMWLSAPDADIVLPASIAYEFPQAFKLHEMRVWNSNQRMESSIGYGAKDVTIEYSLDGVEWARLRDQQFERAPGDAAYEGELVPLDGVYARFVRLTIHSNWGGVFQQAGLSEVEFFYVPVQVWEPQPQAGATGVSVDDVTLRWRSGREAAVHNLFWGMDRQAVLDETVSAISVPAGGSYGSYQAGTLELSQTYYWKVSEVNQAETPGVWGGPVWEFTTSDYIVLDDFEGYKNEPFKEIWATWLDGTEFGTKDPTNGSIVGLDPPMGNYGTAPGQSGGQSLPIWFNNAAAPKSEAIRTFSEPQDWTRAGVTTLALHVYGDGGNIGGQLYVKINDTKIPFNGSPAAITRPIWTPWVIDLAASGANLRSVLTLSIGVEGSGSMGKVYVDDIRLYRLAPAVAQEEIWIEAESGVITRPMGVFDTTLGASAGKYITAEPGNDSTASPPATGVAQYSFIVQGGIYQVACRVIAPTGADNSLWVRIAGATTNTKNDASGWVNWEGIATGADWHWADVHSNNDGNQIVQFTLPAGTHTLEIAYREDGTLVDAIMITDKIN